MILIHKNLLNRIPNKHTSRDKIIILEDNFSEGFRQTYHKTLSENNINILTANGLARNEKLNYFRIKLSESQDKLNTSLSQGYELVDLEIQFKETKSLISVKFNEIFDYQIDIRGNIVQNTFELVVDGENFYESNSLCDLIAGYTSRNAIQQNSKLTFLAYQHLST